MLHHIYALDPMKTNKVLIVSFAVSLLVLAASAQAEQWAKTYGGARGEWASSIRQTADGGFVFAGRSQSLTGDDDVWVVKLHGDGTVDWQKTYGGPGEDWAASIRQTVDGGYVVAGRTTSFGAGAFDAWILKLGADGTIVWQKTYGGPHADWAASIEQTADGGYIVTGSTESFGAGFFDAWVLKLHGDGTIAWQKTYGGPGDDEATSIQQTVDGGFIVAGSTTSFGAGLDVWVLKLEGDGTIAWQKTYGGPRGERAASIQQTADGGFIVAGSTTSFGAGLLDVWVLKLEGDGTIAWQKSYGGQGTEEADSIQQTADGGYIVAGRTDSFGGGQGYEHDAWVLKLASDGTIAWQKTYARAPTNWATTIQQTADGGYIVAGRSNHSFDTGPDVWVLKLDASGEIPACGPAATSSAVVTSTSVTGNGSGAVSTRVRVSVGRSRTVPMISTATESAACPVVGRLRGSVAIGGAPVVDVRVKLKRGVTGEEVTRTSTDTAGVYRFDPVYPGQYRIRIAPLRVERTTTVTGTLEIDEGPSVGTPVRLANPATGTRLRTETDTGGAFTFSQVEPGRYNLIIPLVDVP